MKFERVSKLTLDTWQIDLRLTLSGLISESVSHACVWRAARLPPLLSPGLYSMLPPKFDPMVWRALFAVLPRKA